MRFDSCRTISSLICYHGAHSLNLIIIESYESNHRPLKGGAIDSILFGVGHFGSAFNVGGWL
jgi:hypothetical protein